MFKYTEADLEAGRKALGGGGVGNPIDLIVDYGKGAELFDKAGRSYIDCTSQAWSLNVGYSHPKVVARVTEFIKSYTHVRTSFQTIPKLLLSKKLAELAPGNLKKVSYALSGSDANEGSVKLAMRNRPKSNTLVSLMDGYHGRTLAMINTSWPHPNNRFTAWSAPVLRIPQANCYRCPLKLTYPKCEFACVDLAKDIIQRGASEPPYALIMEPFQGNGGMTEFPDGYLPAMRKMCDDLDMLLIFDEIQTGFGRMGEWFAADLYHTTPDIMTIGKALGGGFPIFGNLARADLATFSPGDHSFTFAHFPVSMVAALAAIEITEEENLLENCRKMGSLFKAGLRALQEKYEFIGDVRGPGLMIGIEMVKDRTTKEPNREIPEFFIREGLKRGAIFGESKYLGLGNIVKIKPPLVITENQVVKVLEIFGTICEDVTKLKN
jgi:4-aminobutyrate aminotransferase-like enzyme